MKNQTDVLVVGGGFGGVAAAEKLAENGIDVTLIDRKNYFEVTFGTLRNVADPKLLGNTTRKRYADFIKGEFVQGSIESMNDREVKLTNGETTFSSPIYNRNNNNLTIEIKVIFGEATINY